MTRISLLLLVLASGCASHTWTEQTDTWRALGEPEQAVETHGVEDLWLRATTPLEEDGFQITERLRTGEAGEVRISLLPAALQALAYGHAVTLEFRRLEDDELVHSSVIDAEAARAVVAEWRVQVRLGAKPRLRATEERLMERIEAASGDAELRAMLREIKPAVQRRMDWE